MPIGYTMKIIKVSDEVHKRMVEDKKHFAKVIGIYFTFNDTIKEYHKILDQYGDKE
jgi:hypothetical protein